MEKMLSQLLKSMLDNLIKTIKRENETSGFTKTKQK